MDISVIIPCFNEEKYITGCLETLRDQTLSPKEIIIVDDGSSDKTVEMVKSLSISNLILLTQSHKGPGLARNLGAKHASAEILVFVDSDMEFSRDFLEKLTLPISEGKTNGTFSKDEYVKNWDNVWAKCWNINQNIKDARRVPKNYPDNAPVFRAILKSEFERVGGYDDVGYTDDWTLSKKLGYQSDNAPAAIFYHRNPENLKEVYKQARWIGKNEFLTRTVKRRIFNLIRYSIISSVVIGLLKSIINKKWQFLIFKIIYDWGVFLSVIKSFFYEAKAK